ncbi:hypothetical protein DSL72_004708 [Monilinia vaccinii-corymbosi]|uniref:Mitochondrial outer membrane protein OM14 C-terminal domain-containing protein n=1 Tax=Monilinia vaccinii-corymbosi TaxID=61207 RepID=A0A8A3P7U6_9HELO|nr:hypothetical protein DSL72_004708 [Monilinia vaccinii-corymbosi]
MSYAQVAASGPQQTDEEKRAPAPPSIVPTESSSISSLIDVDTDSVHIVPSDFQSQPVQTETQAKRLEEEEEEEAEQIEAKIRSAKDAASKKSKKGKSHVRENSENPVVIANAIAVAALSTGLGFGAYQKYAKGELTWKVVGAWAGVAGALAVGDYYLSSYLFKTKYPSKNLRFLDCAFSTFVHGCFLPSKYPPRFSRILTSPISHVMLMKCTDLLLKNFFFTSLQPSAPLRTPTTLRYNDGNLSPTSANSSSEIPRPSVVVTSSGKSSKIVYHLAIHLRKPQSRSFDPNGAVNSKANSMVTAFDLNFFSTHRRPSHDSTLSITSVKPNWCANA